MKVDDKVIEKNDDLLVRNEIKDQIVFDVKNLQTHFPIYEGTFFKKQHERSFDERF